MASHVYQLIDVRRGRRELGEYNCFFGTATKRSITQRLHHKTKLLLNVAAHNVAVTKRKSYKT
jgi:hypothetical protein